MSDLAEFVPKNHVYMAQFHRSFWTAGHALTFQWQKLYFSFHANFNVPVSTISAWSIQIYVTQYEFVMRVRYSCTKYSNIVFVIALNLFIGFLFYFYLFYRFSRMATTINVVSYFCGSWVRLLVAIRKYIHCKTSFSLQLISLWKVRTSPKKHKGHAV